ncbi:MAG: right-handed parallel beta-helix repeat-containing protein [Crocinitomicaceae bacterium]|nr:right-handed parallel beta-helix repeat-containing protein [Crocinitomicaceae bacterium]MDC0100376.1 right-handed parallel beta-helix repeat-containing protein [Crocinitomicaceae bacterium]MDC1385476.1 right-handed parallel beta-helix repeat-containing protein [Crocinitomicaceae bacterium]
MNKSYIYFFYFALLVTIASMSSCKKTTFYSTENLSFSRDTVLFDTVFTTIGSTTQQFKIYNNDSKTITIEQIELMGGSASPFRINVDGMSGTNHANIELEGNDSLFVFVEVTLDPNNGTTPMIIEDQVRFRTNGTDQEVALIAYGQDAYFHTTIFSQGILDINSGVWPNDKPHVIYGAAIIDSATSLNIQQGTKIYLHDGAYLFNYKGQLNIEGSEPNPVTFQGDRLEAAYDDISGAYYGIYMQEALPSTINYAVIKNATSGIHMFSEDPSNTDYTLKVSNTVIQNCASYGVFLYSGARIKAENCLISGNGVHSLLVLEGGDFNFNHCHLLGYGNGATPGAAVGISNHFVRDNIDYIASINEGTITNSVIYGFTDYELAYDTIPDPGITLNFLMANNLIKSDDIFTDPFFTGNGNLWNIDPQFMDITEKDFTYTIGPLRDGGTNAYPNTIGPAVGVSITGAGRPTGPARDIGAYEF